jgi:urea transport system permease protein
MLELAIVIFVAIALLTVIPGTFNLIGQGIRINQLGRYMSLAIVALGIDLIWGYTGILSLGHGLFFALGGYALAMYLQLQIPAGQLPDFFILFGVKELPALWQPFYSLPFTLFAIAILPMLLAGLLGYLVFRNRIRGVYFSILTQAMLIVFYNFFTGQQKLINGTNGLKTDTTLLFGQLVGSPPMQGLFYTVTVILLVAAYFLCRWLTSGQFGRLLVAIRDDEPRVRFSGYNPTAFKVLVFAVSAGLAGISGALYTVQSGIISPSQMGIAFSIEMVIWVAVGGRATLLGPLLGTIFVKFAESLLSEKFPSIWLFFQGGLFLLVVMLIPNGFVGLIQQIPDLWRSLIHRNRLMTYPSLETDPEVQYERDTLTDRKSDR